MGILHRDVKLENLLCDTSTRPPKVKLCDFGHAVTHRDMSEDRHFYGTPGYAAPEVMQGPVWTPKADVWAMGVVMYALLANALPFEYEDGWRRPPDLSSRVWWRVSLEAKLLLQSLLEPQLDARGSLQTFEQSAWAAASFEQGRDESAMRHAFSFTDMTNVGSQMTKKESQKVATGRAGALPHAASWTELQAGLMDGVGASEGPTDDVLVGTTTSGHGRESPGHAERQLASGGMALGGAAQYTSPSSSDLSTTLAEDALMAELLMPGGEGGEGGSSCDATPSHSPSLSPSLTRRDLQLGLAGMGLTMPAQYTAPPPGTAAAAAAPSAAKHGAMFSQLPPVPVVPRQQQAMDDSKQQEQAMLFDVTDDQRMAT